MFFNHRIVICVLAAILLLPKIASAKTIEDSKFGFILEIPDDYVGFPDLVTRRSNFVYAFRKLGVGGHMFDSYIIIERLYTPVDPKHMTDKDIPKNFQTDLITAPWKGLDIDAFKNLETIEGDVVMACKARVPLKDEAIQIWVAGNME